MIMNKTFGMIRMMLLTFSKLGDKVQGFEMVIIPVYVALQFGCIQLIGSIGIRGCPFTGDLSILRMSILCLMTVHENIVILRSNGVLVQMNYKRKLDAVNRTEVIGKRVDIKIARTALVAIPLDIKGVRINEVSFANAMIAIHFKNNFYIGLNTKEYIKFYFAPANIKFIIEIIDSLKIAAQMPMGRHGIMFCYLHVITLSKFMLFILLLFILMDGFDGSILS